MFGSTVAMAGRSMPAMVFSTKREIAISAPVLPALTQACASPALHQVHRDAHRRILLVAHRLRRRLVHRHDLARRVHAQRAPGARRARQLALDRVALPDQHDVDVGCARLEFERGRHRHAGPWSPPMQSTATVTSATTRPWS
jgi:hypothetical protein